ncbi:MAG: hypothetical protein Q9P01_11865 [Anaerolineae bacterium]|nr:hypothetical protein [Anaerolineae bacterium]
MSENINDKELESEVQSGMELAQNFVKKIDFSDVQSGDWFIQLLWQVISTNKKMCVLITSRTNIREWRLMILLMFSFLCLAVMRQ